MSKAENMTIATADLMVIAEQLKKFGEKYEYGFVTLSYMDGSITGFTAVKEPNQIEIYLEK